MLEDERDLERVSTGSPEADAILGGGFPANSIIVLMGHPGTGKTVFAQQMVFHNATVERPILYLTTLSEPLPKVLTYLQRFDFFDPSKLGGAVIYEDIGQDLVERGVGAVLDRVREAIKTTAPSMIVIDSFKVVHDLGASPAEIRRLMFELAGLLTAYEVTTVLIGEYSAEHIPRYPEFAIADCIVELARHPTNRRDERYLRVLKLRGSQYREGAHAFHLRSSGLEIHPRLVTPRVPIDYTVPGRRVSTGVEGLDELLDGGLWAGSNTLVLGDSGAGKTTFGLSYALEGLRRGEPSLFLNFQENPVQLARTIGALGTELDAARREGLHLMYVSPVELQIDSVIAGLFKTIEAEGIRRVVIDPLGDLALAADDLERFHDYVYALVQHFVVQGITSIMTLERGVRHLPDLRGQRLSMSSVADGVIELGMVFEPAPRRTLQIRKARGIAHDLRRHELVIHGSGLRVGGPAPE